jgi:hypothetical protein
MAPFGVRVGEVRTIRNTDPRVRDRSHLNRSSCLFPASNNLRFPNTPYTRTDNRDGLQAFRMACGLCMWKCFSRQPDCTLYLLVCEMRERATLHTSSAWKCINLCAKYAGSTGKATSRNSVVQELFATQDVGSKRGILTRRAHNKKQTIWVCHADDNWT